MKQTLRWRRNGHDGVSNHQPHVCLLNCLFGRRSKKHLNSASLAFVWGIHQMASNAKNVSIWWHHHGTPATLFLKSWSSWWLITRLWWLQCINNGVITVLHLAMDLSFINTSQVIYTWLTLCCVLLWIDIKLFNSLLPSDAIGCQRSGSTLAQVMACCLTASSHYLNQYWLMISEVLWHSPDNNFTENT